MTEIKKLRNIGYDIVVNNFETLYRDFLKNDVILKLCSPTNWKDKIPTGVWKILIEDNPNIEKLSIDPFFEELYLWCLKEISLQSEIFSNLQDFFGERIEKKFLIDFFDEVNEFRRKIAHGKSNVTNYDVSIIVEKFKLYCKGPKAKPFVDYLSRGEYNSNLTIPSIIKCLEICEHNLPVEDYDLDGGYVGRRKEVVKIKKMLFSNQDRIISITGAGGLGKTALALKTSYSIISMGDNPYKFIIWFSAKENKLTAADGIVSVESQITDYDTLLLDIIKILDFEIYTSYNEDEYNYDLLCEIIYEIFKSTRCLLIIDNLETITNDDIINFIKDIPRPSQVLITSRRGLGEIERRYPLPDFSKLDGRNLFRIVSKEKNRQDLQKLSNEIIETYVTKVKCYPLLIKWSIGKVCLGKDINEAFLEIYSGDSDISEFVFNDIYEMLSENSKKCLFAMIVLGDKPVSKHLIQHLTSLSNDNLEDSLKELTLTSFVFNEVFEVEKEVHSYYSMLTLTRGFIRNKMDENKELRTELQQKYREISYQIEQTEKSKIAFYDSLSAFGIESEEDKIAFNYIKTAKNYLRNDNFSEASKFFKKAYQISPNLSYVLMEYAKFEFSINHIENCMELIVKAKSLDPDNFHIYYSHGIILRKQNLLQEAISELSIAKQLNPNFIPVYNELGRTYTFNGSYAEAELEFESCLSLNSNIINYKYLNLTYYFQSDNYRRWSEFYSIQGDHQKSINILIKSLSIIKNAIRNNSNDNKNLQLERKISKDLGVAYCKQGNFIEGFKLLSYAASTLKNSSGFILRNEENSAYANYYMASFGYKKNKLTKEESLSLLNTANKQCKNYRTKAKIERLIDEISGDNFYRGKIEFYNRDRKFGVISLDEQNSYTFLWSSIRSYVPHNEIYNLEGKDVTFKLKDLNSKKVAYSVEVLEFS